MNNIKNGIAAFILIFSTACFAIDNKTISLIHARIKLAVIEMCKNKFTQLSSSVCICLGDKSQSNLNDPALKSCTVSPTNASCANNVILSAVKSAFTNDNLKACGSTLTYEQLIRHSGTSQKNN